MADFELIDLMWPYILRGTSVQTTNVFYNHFAQPTTRQTGVGLATAGPQAFLEGITLNYFNLQNRSGGTIYMGIGVRIPNRCWIAGQWTNAAATPFTDDTIDAQDRDADDFALETSTDNDGYVVASKVPFNAVGIDVSTASVGGAGVARAWRHTNRNGSGWVGSTADETIVSTAVGVTGTNYATGENVVVIAPMTDWGPTQTAGLNGIPGGYYALNVRATNAPGTPGLATALELYRIYFIKEAFADNSSYEVAPVRDLFMPGGDMLVPFFSVANLGNRVTALVRAGR